MNLTAFQNPFAIVDLGLACACCAAPAVASAEIDPALGLGLYAQVAPSAGSASTDGPSNALYTTQALAGGGVFNTPNAGLRTSLGSASTVIASSPAPMPPGLLAGSVDVQANASQATASASLARGESRLLALSSSTVPTSVTAQTYLADTVTWQVGSAAGADVTFAVHVEGSVGGIAGGAFYNQNVGFGLGNSGFGWGAVASPFGGSQFSSSGLLSWQSASLTGQSVAGFDFSGVVHVTNGSTSLLTFSQSIACNGGARCDFSNTARLAFVLPPGVSYRSSSGELFAAAVPEPASWLLMAGGLVVAAAGLRAGRHARHGGAAAAAGTGR